MLYKFTPENGVVLVSTGTIADAAGSKREPPYSMFVDQKSRFIALLLYENTVKIIPVGKQEDNLVLRNSFSVRIRHPEVHKILNINNDDLGNQGDGIIAVLYQEQSNARPQGMPPRISKRIRQYSLSIADKDAKLIDTGAIDDFVELSEKCDSNVYTLPFGGLIAFE